MAVMLRPLPRLLPCRRSIWDHIWFPAPKECPRHLPAPAEPCPTSLGQPKLNLPGASGAGQDLPPLSFPFPSLPSHPFLSLPVFLPSRFPSLPAPFPHVLTAEADADDEDDEGDDGGYQGDDDDLALVPSQVEQIHPLAASAGVASLAPAPQHRGGRGGSQKLPWRSCPPHPALPGRTGTASHPVPPCPHRG